MKIQSLAELICRTLGVIAMRDGSTIYDHQTELAQAYGFDSWNEMPKTLRALALKDYIAGRADEARAARSRHEGR